MHSIDAITEAYELLREVRGKHPRNACHAQEAADALRDVPVLRICYLRFSTAPSHRFWAEQSVNQLRS